MEGIVWPNTLATHNIYGENDSTGGAIISSAQSLAPRVRASLRPQKRLQAIANRNNVCGSVPWVHGGERGAVGTYHPTVLLLFARVGALQRSVPSCRKFLAPRGTAPFLCKPPHA
eukprot:152569-Chlamydomonas_euryale.AAC.2